MKTATASKSETILIHDESTHDNFIVDFGTVSKAWVTLWAISNPTRKRILVFLNKHEKSQVRTIYKSLKMPQPVVSHQLSILRNAGIVTTERLGKTVNYSLNNHRLREIVHHAESLASGVKVSM